MKVPIGVSARHVHLTKEHFEILFGKDEKLGVLRNLTQPGEFASDKTVTIKGDKGSIDNVRIVGPFRTYTQVEISKTDSYKLGVNPPVRKSGDLEGSSPITIVGPKGEIKLNKGCILATRHIHMTPEDAKRLNLEGETKVKVLIDGIKGGILHNVILRVEENYKYELHLDLDDANAFLVNQGDVGTIIKYEKNI